MVEIHEDPGIVTFERQQQLDIGRATPAPEPEQPIAATEIPATEAETETTATELVEPQVQDPPYGNASVRHTRIGIVGAFCLVMLLLWIRERRRNS